MAHHEARWERGMVGTVKKTMPKRGDIVWITLDPTRGHEQAGRRPAVVLSTHEFNRTCGLALIVPVTSKDKGYTNEVPVITENIHGAALTSHLRAIDWNERRVEFIDHCPGAALREIQEMCTTYISGE